MEHMTFQSKSDGTSAVFVIYAQYSTSIVETTTIPEDYKFPVDRFA